MSHRSRAPVGKDKPKVDRPRTAVEEQRWVSEGRMRTVIILAGLIAFALTTTASAQTERMRPSGAAGGAVQGGAMAPPATGGKPAGAANPVRPPVGGVNAQLTKAECEGLGGKVRPNVYCSLGACWTTDKNGVIHNICITEAK